MHERIWQITTTDTKIEKAVAREILDSRGKPTVEVDVGLAGGAQARAVVPYDRHSAGHRDTTLRF